MKAYRVTAIDGRDDANLGRCLVVAESFDEARTAALEHFKTEWTESTQVELSAIETLNDDVVIASQVSKGIVEARI